MNKPKSETEQNCITLAGIWKAIGELANVSSRYAKDDLRKGAQNCEDALNRLSRDFIAEWNSDITGDGQTIHECINANAINGGCEIYTASPDSDGRCANCHAAMNLRART